MANIAALVANGEGSSECLRGASVITDAKVDVAGHMEHVAGGGSQATQDLGAVERFFGVVGGFESVNVIVVGGGVFRIFLEYRFQPGERVLTAGIREEDARLSVFRVISDDSA